MRTERWQKQHSIKMLGLTYHMCKYSVDPSKDDAKKCVRRLARIRCAARHDAHRRLHVIASVLSVV